MNLPLEVNGQKRTLEVTPAELLIDTLRGAGYVGVKRGCETGDCGACAVIMDGRAVNACVTFSGSAANRRVLTIEGVGSAENLHPIQEAFIDCGAVQCGFCTPGMILLAKVLLEENPDPTEAEVRKALGGMLCRCTGYRKPVDAVLAAAEKMRGNSSGSSGRKGS